MCDFYSWIEKGEGKDKKLFYLRDDEIKAKWPYADIRDKIGHSAIEEYFPEAKGGKHCESALKVPVEIADAINRGDMSEMAKAGRWAGVHYDNKGKIDSPWWLEVEKLIKRIKKNKWFDNHGKLDSDIKLFDTRDAAGDAARDVARDVAWGAAWDAAWAAAWDAASDGARDAARDVARGAAWDAASDGARDAARDVARGAARDVALDAAGDAEIMASVYIAELPIDNHYRVHVEKRMAVWFAGYGVLCDVDGVIYAYKKP